MTAHAARDQSALVLAGTAAMPQPEAAAPFSASLARQLRRRIVTAFRHARELRALRQLSDRALADIGLTRTELPLVFDPEFVRCFNAERTTRRIEILREPDAVERTQINEKRMGFVMLMCSVHS